jgi:hypothetical protein
MQATHEMTVRRSELVKAISLVTSDIARVREHSRRTWDWIFLSGLENALAITIEDGPIELVQGSGFWPTPIEVDALLLLRLSEKFPKTREITLVYSSGRLLLGPTNVPAGEAVIAPKGVMNSRDELCRIFQTATQEFDACEDELSYDDMHHLADVIEGWSMDRNTKPKNSAALLGWAENLRNQANRLGQDWAPEYPERLSIIGFIAKILREGK